MAKCSASYTLTHLSDGSQGAQGFSIVASVSREGWDDAMWATYCSINHIESWTNTANKRNGCRIGDLFTVVGTSTSGKAYTATFRSINDNGDLFGICISCVYSDKGAKGDNGTPATVASTTVAYQNSTNGTTPPTGTWTSTASPTKGQYTWTRTTITFNPSGSAVFYSVAYEGTNGKDGNDGNDAVQYYYHVVFNDSDTVESNYGTTWTSQAYMGTYYDTSLADASTFAEAQSKGVKWARFKGPKGDGIGSIFIEYGVSDSQTTTPTTWTTDSAQAEASWQEGTWLWTRKITTYTDGSEATTEITKQYNPKKIWDFTLSQDSRTYDLRNPNGNTVITLTPTIQGYITTPIVEYNGIEITLVNGKYSATIPNSDKNDTVFRMYSQDNSLLDASKKVKAIDVTEYNKFLGTAESSSATTLSDKLRGDAYVDTTESIIKWFDGTDWKVFDLSMMQTSDAGMVGRILSNAEKAYWDLYSTMSDAQKKTLNDLYGYKADVLARFISAKRIQMYGEGVIASSSISTNPSEDIDDKGFLNATGYRLEGDTGIVRATSAYLSQVNIDNKSNLYGTIESPSLSTHNGSNETRSYESKTTSNTKFWSYADLSQAMVSNVITNESGTYNGNAVSKYAKVLDSSYCHPYIKKGAFCCHPTHPNTSGYEEIVEIPLDDNYHTETYTYTNVLEVSQDISIAWHSQSYMASSTQQYLRFRINGTVVFEKKGTRGSYGNPDTNSGTYTGTLPSGAVLTIEACTGEDSASSFYCYAFFNILQSVLYTEGITSKGLWLYYLSAWNKLQEIPYQSTPLSILGVTNRYIRWENNCYLVGELSSTQTGGITGLSSGSYVKLNNGESKPIVSVTWNTNSIVFMDSQGNAYVISKDTYYSSFEFAFSVLQSSSFVKAINLLPKEAGSNIGDQSNPWNALYVNGIYANTISGDFTGNATSATTATSAGKLTNPITITITDGTNTSVISNVDGSGNITLTLPTKIKGAVFN